MSKYLTGVAAAALMSLLPSLAMAQDVTPGKDVSMVLLPKFLGILPFDQAHKGAEEAAKELKNPAALQFLGPTPQNSVAGQIEIVTNATTQGVKAIMISNNSGDQIVPAAKAAQAKGIKVVTWDSSIPSAEGEDVFVAQVDFTDIGKVMADMTLDLTGPEGGEFAILSASPDASNQNAWIAAMKTTLKDPKYAKLKLDDVVYGNDELEKSYTQTQALLDKYPKVKVIMAPTSVGIVAGRQSVAGRKSSATKSKSAVSGRRARCSPTRRTAARRIRLVELCRSRLSSLLHRLCFGHRLARGQGGGEVQGRAHGRIHHHQGSDTRQGSADPDGAVHDLQQGQRRSRGEVAICKTALTPTLSRKRERGAVPSPASREKVARSAG